MSDHPSNFDEEAYAAYMEREQEAYKANMIERYGEEAWLGYLKHCEEQEVEEAARVASGGRTICPECGERSVTHRTVVTYGYEGHPGADHSDLAECGNCDYKEV